MSNFLTYCGIYYCLSVLYVSLRLYIARRKMIYKHSVTIFDVVMIVLWSPIIVMLMLFLNITNLFSKK